MSNNGFVMIKSSDRLAESKNSDDFYLDCSKFYKEGDYLTPISITLPYTQYNVNNNNNKIYFDENGTDRTGTLTNGDYSAADLAAEIVVAMDAAGGNDYACTNDSKTYKFTFTKLGTGDNVNFHFTWGTNTSNSARILLGFTAVDGTSAASQVSNQAYNLSEPNLIRVIIDGTELERSEHEEATLSIPTNVTAGSLIHYVYEKHEVKPFKLNISNVGRVHFRLLDWENNDIDLNGSEWYLKCRRN